MAGSICLAAAAALDSPSPAVGGALFIFAALIAKEAWLSGGRRGWLLTALLIAVVVGVAFVVQTLSS